MVVKAGIQAICPTRSGDEQSFPILKALHSNHHVGRSPGYALPDGAWHVTDYYDNIRSSDVAEQYARMVTHDFYLIECVMSHERQERVPPSKESRRHEHSKHTKVSRTNRCTRQERYDPPDAQPFLEAPTGRGLSQYCRCVGFVPNMARIQTASSHGGQMNNETNSDRKLANPAIVPGWDGP
jgi:hypothetical protein